MLGEHASMLDAVLVVGSLLSILLWRSIELNKVFNGRFVK